MSVDNYYSPRDPDERPNADSRYQKTSQQIWPLISEKLRTMLDPAEYQAWIEPLKAKQQNESE